MSVDRATFPVIHAVTDTATVSSDGFLDRAGAVMRTLGSRGALHLRSSRLSGREFFEIATLLAPRQKSTGCWLIVNDRVDVALAVGARGVQLASHSLHVDEARRVSGSIPVGASIHTVEEAVEAERSGASWCVAGTVFETPSHKGRPPARVDFVEQVAAAVGIPIIAIGGVRPEDVASIIRAGAHGVATIRGAGWERLNQAAPEEDSLLKTRLPVEGDAGYVEPVTHYISAYDSVSGSGKDDHPDGKRGPTRAGA